MILSRKAHCWLFSALLLCGCIKVTRLDKPIADQSTVFENRYLAITYPQGWVITNEAPFWIYDPRDDFRPAVIGEREIYTFRDPFQNDYAVWINLDRSRPARGAAPLSLETVLRETAARYRFFLEQENFARITDEVRPVAVDGRRGLELTVRGEGKKPGAAAHPLTQGLQGVRNLVLDRTQSGEPAKEYHVILLELDNTMVRLHFVLVDTLGPGIRDRIKTVVDSLRIKEGFRAAGTVS